MEELAKIIRVVAERTEVTQTGLIHGNEFRLCAARHVLSHILWHGFPYLVGDFAKMSGRSRSTLYSGMKAIEGRMTVDKNLLDLVNGIRAELGLPTIRQEEEKSEEEPTEEIAEETETWTETISGTRRLFGFDYGEDDKALMRKAQKEAAASMGKRCSYGRKPCDLGATSIPASSIHAYLGFARISPCNS